ncbi:intein C-terminal splicing region/intein N-terminal splicing region [Mucilaginibacter sp. OK268]|uniref:polymorphic toxin-type HINT domain-containing protein n=1 Tax=Mucilaginibacter sp. OK268 TaxID=1881048 RepID=UPI000891B5A1|nr:polymorphic toxin-type HINT domain-containing protein [Mucilaginibacter sp. OK268]SDQ00826.1 intein C-terminal splicing region/intein N-terminal splicing region [Mucilaginibacter sp. OK268]
MAEDLQWLTEKHYLVCPKGAMFKQMKVDKSRTAIFSGNLVANTRDTMKDNVFVCLGSMAFMAGAIAGLLVAALALMAVPVAGWALAAIIGGALLLAIGIGYMKCKSNAGSRQWVNPSPNLIVDGHEGLVVKQSQLCCTAENVMIDIKETFWEAMMSTTMHDVGHIANFAFGFLAGRGMGSMAGTAATSGLRAAGAEFLNVAKAEMGNMFNPATLFGKMSWLCRGLRGLGMFGAYKGQYDIWTNPEMSTTDKLLASGQELVLAIFAAKGASLVCFPAGTQVHTSNGLVGIETIAIGSVVWTMNEATGQRELKPVTQIHRRTTLSMIVLELDNGTIFQVTPEHRFLVNGEWREIQNISAAEELELIDGRKVTIKNIGLISKVSTVYNFDVADNENYFVTEDGVLVHNGYTNKAQVKNVTGEAHTVEVSISKSDYPETAKHIEDAIASGKPNVVTIERDGAKANRATSLRGVKTKPNLDRDEWPMAMFKEGGKGASVRHINPGDNRGAGSAIGNALSDYPDGTVVKIIITD